MKKASDGVGIFNSCYMEVIVLIVFFILSIIEGRKEKRDPTYRSWMTRGDSHWDHWNHTKYGE